MPKIITENSKETQKLGQTFAKKILGMPIGDHAVVLGLEGNLGGGKTSFLQGFAEGLGIKEKILSPTFVILKRFPIKKGLRNFYHIDCYRLENEKDILELDFERIISDPKNIVAIEWPGKIIKILPKDFVEVKFEFVDENRREIDF